MSQRSARVSRCIVEEAVASQAYSQVGIANRIEHHEIDRSSHGLLKRPAKPEEPFERRWESPWFEPRPWDDKARFLARARFDRERPETLLRALRELAAQGDAASDGANEYGELLQLDGTLVWVETAGSSLSQPSGFASTSTVRCGL